MYAIDTDPARNLILVRLGGMMSVDEVAEYMHQLRRRFVEDSFRAGYRILVDVSECLIQSQDMIIAMGKHMATFPKASRIAMVSRSSLARMQIRRLMTQSYASVFETPDEALAWLVEERAAA
jgi:hypothetical protein